MNRIPNSSIRKKSLIALNILKTIFKFLGFTETISFYEFGCPLRETDDPTLEEGR